MECHEGVVECSMCHEEAGVEGVRGVVEAKLRGGRAGEKAGGGGGAASRVGAGNKSGQVPPGAEVAAGTPRIRPHVLTATTATVVAQRMPRAVALAHHPGRP